MKRIVTILLSLCLVCLLSGCVAHAPSIFSNFKSESNQCGEAKILGKIIYFTNSFDNGKIYCMKTDGSEKRKLNDDRSPMIYVSGDKIYYENSSDDSKLYCMNIDGSDKRKLTDDRMISAFWNVVGNQLYYSNFDDNDALYSMKTDGSQRKKLSDENTLYLTVSKDRIYYSTGLIDAKGIYSMKVDGTGKITLSNDNPFGIVVSGDWIYYVNTSDDDKLYAMRTNGRDRHKLSDDYALNINIVHNRIYYSTGNAGEIYSIKTDGSDRKLLSDDDAEWLLVQDGRIYYTITGSKIYSMNTDGSDKLTLTDLTENTYKEVTYEISASVHKDMPKYRFVATGTTGTDIGYVMGLKAFNERGNLILSADFSETFGDEVTGNPVYPEMMDTMGLHIVDVNFDGYGDVIILNSFCGAHNNTWYNCWLWDTQTSSFIESKSFTEICNPALDPKNQCIYSAGGSGAAYWGGSIYQYIDSEFIMTNNLDADSNGLTETELVNGNMVVVRKVSYTAGDKSEEDEMQYYKTNKLWQLDAPRWYMAGGHEADQWLGG